MALLFWRRAIYNVMITRWHHSDNPLAAKQLGMIACALNFTFNTFFSSRLVTQMAKSTCPVTRAEFLNDAQPVEITINGIPMTADVKEFSTGSLGWYLNGKANVKVGDKSVSVQIGMNLTIVGSKELPK